MGENEKPDSKLRVNGAYSLNKQHNLEWFSENQLNGARWLNKHTSRTPMVVYREGKAAQNVIIRPKAHIKVRANGEQSIFDIEIKAPAAITEIFEEIDEKELGKLISKQITEEVEQTFKLGKSRGIDVYDLEHVLYRDEFKTWAKLTNYGEKALSDYELGNISVKAKILHSGMLKMNEKNDSILTTKEATS